MAEPVETKCGICSAIIGNTGTERCDRCWELEKRVLADPELARAILDELDQKGEVDG